MTDICQDCGCEFEQIGHHLFQAECEWPTFSDKQKEILTGLVMSDAYVARDTKRPYIRLAMINKKYLMWLDNKFPNVGQGVSLYRTAEEGAKQNRENGFSENAEKENYSDLYMWTTSVNPNLQKFANWYKSGKKVWPDNIELTPTVLKHLYIGDGSFNTSGGNNNISIGLSNERKNKEKIEKMFNRKNLPKPKWDEYERDDGSMCCSVRWNNQESMEVLNYMGEPPTGFEYKWPDDYR